MSVSSLFLQKPGPSQCLLGLSEMKLSLYIPNLNSDSLEAGNIVFIMVSIFLKMLHMAYVHYLSPEYLMIKQ